MTHDFPIRPDFPETVPAASATELRSRLLRAGTPGAEVMSHLVRAAEVPDAQREWGGWSAVRNRDELLLRMEVLARTDRLEPDLVEFVLFFFRSSDPGLYQPAALAAGRHLGAHPAIEEEFTRYAKLRGAGESGPVRFPGGRSARRILLARARSGRPGDGVHAFPETLPDDGVGRADLAAILLAADWIVADRGPEGVPPILRDLVSRVLSGPAMGTDRALTGRLAGLLSTLRSRDAETPDWIQECWESAASRAAGLATELPAGEALARLRSLDELARAYATFPDGSPGPGEGGQAGNGWLRPGFLGDRISAWQAFLGRGLPPDKGERRRAHRRLARGMRMLHTRRDWIRVPPEDRAETLFGLLDPLSIQRLGPEAIGMLLDAWLDADPGEGTGFDDESSFESALVGAVLPRFLEWEGGGAMVALEPGLVHRLDTEGLVRVLGLDPEPGLAPVLADTLEHRFRFSLAVDPAFDPEALLLRVAAARPSPYLWRALRDLVQGRTYQDGSGEEFPLAAWIEGLESDAASGETEGVPLAQHTAVAGTQGPTARLRQELTSELARIAGEEDLHDRLLRLAALLSGESSGGRGADEDAGGGSLQSYWRRLVPDSPVPLPASVGHAFVQMAGGLRPQRRAQVVRLRTFLVDVRGEADELARRLARTLPPPEGEAVSDLIFDALRDVEEALGSFALLEEFAESGSLLVEEVEGLLRRFLSVRDAGVRAACLVLLWRELSAEAGLPSAGSDERDDPLPTEWHDAEELLAWAVAQGSGMDPETRAVWETAVAGGWASLARDAMGAGHAGRLGRLVRNAAYEPVIARRDNLRLLEEVRRWLLDVYRPWEAARVVHLTRLAHGQRGQIPTWLRAAPLFVGHYGSVWLALLIGAILMLDFGDAWTAMAEVGDVRGIGYTVALGLLGGFAYITVDLRKRLRPAPEDPRWRFPVETLVRASGFLVACLTYTALLTAGLWLLLSGTDEVVHGDGAPLHVAVWTGFALFIGVFFGLLAKRSA